ncbi:endolytic transglycosylase MltG, partial [Patescibacteria group bacterium]|nr:endolytic transglycosylase MltG [Patescibacteria group bacterium]
KLDSLYNTYIYKGRPPTPISNPGLAAINAVINSEESEYLYYLHDSEGQIHLAKTYEEHLQNIEEYLK